MCHVFKFQVTVYIFILCLGVLGRLKRSYFSLGKSPQVFYVLKKN